MTDSLNVGLSSSPSSVQLVGGRYELIRKIGSGGMGVVYLARQLGLGKQVALKFLHAHLSEDPQLRQRFEREAALSLQMIHPGAAQLLDTGVESDGRLYLVFEYVEGEDLCSLLDRDGALSCQETIELTCKVAETLFYAHGKGLVHRDLKPENIRVRRDLAGLHVKVLDFGIARVMDAVGTQLTQEGHVAGTPRYMAPEQIEGAQVDARTDIYALGLVLFESVTGREAFNRENTSQLLWAQLYDAVPPLREVQPLRDMPELDAIIAKACAKAPAERFASMQELVIALKQLHQPQWGPAAPVLRRKRAVASAHEEIPTQQIQIPQAGRKTFLQIKTNAWLGMAVGCIAVVLAGAALWLALDRRTVNVAVPPVPAPPIEQLAHAQAPAQHANAPAVKPAPSSASLPSKAREEPGGIVRSKAIITGADASVDKCVQRQQWSSDECLDAITAYSQQHPEQQFEMGKRVRLNFMHWAAVPFFDAALRKSATPARCADPDVAMAVISGLSLPMGRDEKKMAEHIFSGACFQGLRPAVEKELSDSGASSPFGLAACPILYAKGLKLPACVTPAPADAQASAATPPLAVQLPVIDLAQAPFGTIKIYRGQDGARLTVAEVLGKTNVFVLRFDGIRAEWNGKPMVHELEPGMNQSGKWWTLHQGKRWYTLVSRGERYSAYVPGALDGMPFFYSGDDSKNASADALR